MHDQVAQGVVTRQRLWLGGVLVAGALACGPGGPAPQTPQLDLQQLEARVREPGPRPLLLVFWATWCAPCVEESPDLVALQARHGNRLDILAVSLDAFLHAPERSQELLQAQFARTPVDYANVLFVGAQDPLFAAFDLPGGIPYAVFYDRDRRVVRHFRGRVEPAWIDSALAR